MGILVILFLFAVTDAQITEYCTQKGILNVQAVVDEAIDMAQNAVLSYATQTLRVGTLWYALIHDPNYYALALGRSINQPCFRQRPFSIIRRLIVTHWEGNLQRVAAFKSMPPKIEIYCGDDHISKATDGEWYDYSDPNQPTPVGSPFIPCSSGAAKGYVIIRTHTNPMVVLCPLGLVERKQIGEFSRHLPQINVPLDNAIGVSGTILHEFLHIANPHGR